MTAKISSIVSSTSVPFSANNSVITSATEAANAGEKNIGGSQEEQMAARKLRLLKRSGLFGGDTKGATIERACGADDLVAAYRLVHDVYLGTGYIKAEPSGMRLRIFETTSETATFVAKVDGRVVGVLSIVGDSPELGLPSDSAFKPELDALRKTGARLCEATNQAVADEYRKTAVPTELMRCAVAHMTKAGYDEAIATVSPNHNGFYDLLKFRLVGSERSYSTKLHDPVVALSMNIAQYREVPGELNAAEQFVYDFMAAGNTFLNRVVIWAKQARQQFLNPELLERLFVSERNFLSECTRTELNILNRRWGQELFCAVSGDQYAAFIDGAVIEFVPAAPVRAETNQRASRVGVVSVTRRNTVEHEMREESASRSTLFRGGAKQAVTVRAGVRFVRTRTGESWRSANRLALAR